MLRSFTMPKSAYSCTHVGAGVARIHVGLGACAALTWGSSSRRLRGGGLTTLTHRIALAHRRVRIVVHLGEAVRRAAALVKIRSGGRQARHLGLVHDRLPAVERHGLAHGGHGVGERRVDAVLAGRGLPRKGHKVHRNGVRSARRREVDLQSGEGWVRSASEAGTRGVSHARRGGGRTESCNPPSLRCARLVCTPATSAPPGRHRFHPAKRSKDSSWPKRGGQLQFAPARRPTPQTRRSRRAQLQA